MRRLLFVLLVSCIACDDGVVGSKTVNGVYTLRSINGSSLPYTSTSGGTTTEIIDDQITFFQGFTYSETGHSRVTTNGQVTNQTINDTGSFSLFGTSVTITSGAGRPERRGTINANTMTITEAGRISVFEK